MNVYSDKVISLHVKCFTSLPQTKKFLLNWSQVYIKGPSICNTKYQQLGEEQKILTEPKIL